MREMQAHSPVTDLALSGYGTEQDARQPRKPDSTPT